MRSRLLRAGKEAERADSQKYTDIVNCIQDDHIKAAKSYMRNPRIVEEFSLATVQECQQLSILLAAVTSIRELSHKSVDMIISKGEILSARFVAALLQDRGIDSRFVNLSDIVDFIPHRGLGQDFYDHVTASLKLKIEACGEQVPVITGFFGFIPGGLLNQIGRGYTDLCAALVAISLHAEELQIWKEVDGIFTADPRKVPTARLLSKISPAEAAELTFYGSEVIHPFTMEQVIQARIPIRIKNVINPHGTGTIIAPEVSRKPYSSVPGHEPNLFRTRTASLSSENQRPKRPTAVTIKHKILVINVHSNKRSISHGFFAKIFSTLDKWRLSVDLISTSEVHVSMALHSDAPLAIGNGGDEKEIIDHDLRGAIQDLQEYGTVDIIDGMAILSLVGKQMKNMIGVAGKMFSTLGENNVNIEMISQGTPSLITRTAPTNGNVSGASEINISCVIEERDADRAINILHTNLFTFLD